MSNTSSPEALKSLCKNCTMSWIDIYLRPRQAVSRVEGYVVVAAALLLILSVLGPMRRRSRSWVVQYGVRAAYLLSFPLLSYVLGLMQGIAKNDMYPVWSTLIVLLFVGANSVSVQKLDENKQWLKLVLDNALYLYYVGTISGSFAFVPGTMVYIRFVPLMILFVLISMKNVDRLTAIMLASDPRSSGSRTVARHMKQYYDKVLSKQEQEQEQEQQPAAAQANSHQFTMAGYNYLVLPFQVYKNKKNKTARPGAGGVSGDDDDGSTRGPKGEKVITLEKIWFHDKDSPSSINDPVMRHLKDVCLSFALFRLVVRRYFKYACAESGHPKTRDLVLRGLLEVEGGDACAATVNKRESQVIHVEEEASESSPVTIQVEEAVNNKRESQVIHVEEKASESSPVMIQVEEAAVKRAFRVIEVELAFLYDFFFTKHAMTMCRGEIRSVLVSLPITILTMGIGAYALLHPNDNSEDKFWDFGLVETQTQGIIVTKVILSAVAIFQLVQVWLYCSSDWAKVSLATKYVTRYSSSQGKNRYVFKKLLSFMGKFWLLLEQQKWFHCRWENKIGQYSVLDSFSSPRLGLERYSELIPMFREGRKRGKPITVPLQVKKAIANTLKKTDGKIPNGVSSLFKDGMPAELKYRECQCQTKNVELYRACQTNNEVIIVAHVILIWHIATSYCESLDWKNPNTANKQPSSVVQGQPTKDDNRLVATTLSKYCAYLVAFAPGLVPGNQLLTESSLDELVHEARKAPQTPTTTRPESTGNQDAQSKEPKPTNEIKDEENAEMPKPSQMFEKIKQKEDVPMLSKGVELAENLVLFCGTEDKLWEVLGHFWAELMLYIAPSDNVAGHIESLAQGGEFVTHVWALLMHAGILERPAATTASELKESIGVNAEAR